MTTPRETLINESNSSLSAAQKRLDRYENLLIGHISGSKTLEATLSEAVNVAVSHYRAEVAVLRVVYLKALDDLKNVVDDSIDAVTKGVEDLKNAVDDGPEKETDHEHSEYDEDEDDDEGDDDDDEEEEAPAIVRKPAVVRKPSSIL